MKNILLSKKIIQIYDWSSIRNSKAVPFIDSNGLIKGCQLILELDNEHSANINLLEQDLNNLHKYQSDIVFTGSKKF